MLVLLESLNEMGPFLGKHTLVNLSPREVNKKIAMTNKHGGKQTSFKELPLPQRLWGQAVVRAFL